MQVTRHCAVTYRIYPDKAQAGLIDRTIGCARLVYNLMLETRIDTYNRTGKSCNPTPAHTRTSIRSYAKWTVSHYATPN